ncbi:hypothetical protein F8M41_018086 [Gigaspora margarita]|uniref:Uncharacterized protein n=1 Tax=Gigaspora margarita TaxID=4874 RepID=A0A8H3ZYH7_GIGMA|nr:hypothetical protein F8M41_018086 [Gigaspora margarita]
MITARQQILKESYTLKSPEYHPQSLSVHNDDSDYISADEESTNQHDNYISITKFLYDNNINPQQFYLKFNEIDSINMVHEYEYSLNNGRCWNYKHNQFKKCKWYTSNSDNLDHDCIGMISKDEKLVLFKDERNFQSYSSYRPIRIFFAQSLKMNSNTWNCVIEIETFRKEYNQLFENWCLERILDEILKQANEFLTTYKPFFGMYNVYYYNLETIKTFSQLQRLLMATYVLDSKFK